MEDTSITKKGQELRHFNVVGPSTLTTLYGSIAHKNRQGGNMTEPAAAESESRRDVDSVQQKTASASGPDANESNRGGSSNSTVAGEGRTSTAQQEEPNVSWQDIKSVQNLIERCLQKFMTQTEIIAALQVEANVDPSFTCLVWQKLEQQNPEFFFSYHARLKMRDQIVAFNYLVDQQVYMIRLASTGMVPHHPLSQHPGFPQGMPATGIPPTGMPPTGIPATGMPPAGMPPTGMQTAVPSTGIPATGIPATGIPGTGALSAGMPTAMGGSAALPGGGSHLGLRSVLGLGGLSSSSRPGAPAPAAPPAPGSNSYPHPQPPGGYPVSNPANKAPPFEGGPTPSMSGPSPGSTAGQASSGGGGLRSGGRGMPGSVVDRNPQASASGATGAVRIGLGTLQGGGTAGTSDARGGTSDGGVDVSGGSRPMGAVVGAGSGTAGATAVAEASTAGASAGATGQVQASGVSTGTGRDPEQRSPFLGVGNHGVAAAEGEGGDESTGGTVAGENDVMDVDVGGGDGDYMSHVFRP